MNKFLYVLCLLPTVVLASADSDFDARCTALGVVLCNGLDNASDLAKGILEPAGDGSIQGAISSDQSTSGGASLRFTFRAGYKSTGMAGDWSVNLPKTFAAGDTLYVQYRWRATPSYFSNNEKHWRTSIKQLNIHGQSSTCQGSEFTTIVTAETTTKGFMEMYTACGIGFPTSTSSTAQVFSCPGDCLLQQGASFSNGPDVGYNCHLQGFVEGDGNGNGCFLPTYNVWYTTYEVIRLGTCGSSNSTVDAYTAVDGGPYKQFHRVTSVRWQSNGDCFLNRLRLETYMTEVANSAPEAANIWYDEVIVSTKPIAAPGAGSQDAIPNPPTDVTAN